MTKRAATVRVFLGFADDKIVAQTPVD